MRMVFSKAQVAEALGMSEAEFDRKRSELERLGFPRPVIGLIESWSMIHVSHWINRDGVRGEGLDEDVASSRVFQ
jgi:predicted DNA-binding transcriptional regulator AlpA